MDITYSTLSKILVHDIISNYVFTAHHLNFCWKFREKIHYSIVVLIMDLYNI